jgi:hypothetical protein
MAQDASSLAALHNSSTKPPTTEARQSGGHAPPQHSDTEFNYPYTHQGR